MGYCDKCGEFFCKECQDIGSCAKCHECFCEECRECIHCSQCGDSFCVECKELGSCDKCLGYFCVECMGLVSCLDCGISCCTGCKDPTGRCGCGSPGPSPLQCLIYARDRHRVLKQYSKADKILKKLRNMGVEVIDGKNGKSTWRWKKVSEECTSWHTVSEEFCSIAKSICQ